MSRGAGHRRWSRGFARLVLLSALGVIGFVVLLGLPRARDRLERSANVTGLEAGVLLEASARLRDGIFDEAVVLVVTHGDEGSVGFVLSGARAADGPLRDGRPAAAEAGVPEARLAWGGPVGPDVFWLVSPEASADRVEIAPGVWVSRTRDLAAVVAAAQKDPALRIVVGGAAWSPGQLADEVRHGAWRVRPAVAERVFGRRPSPEP